MRLYTLYICLYKHLHAWLKWLLPGSHPTTQSVSAHVPAPSLSKVYLVKWYMGHYGASSAKPTKGWCNHRKLGELDLGKFNHKMINPKSKPTTVKKRSTRMERRLGREQRHWKTPSPDLICWIYTCMVNQSKYWTCFWLNDPFRVFQPI